jgi:hypothetical protein
LLASALFPLQEAEVVHLRTCGSQSIDWQAFDALVERHHLLPTVYRNLETHIPELVPQPVLAGLKARAELNQQRVLRYLVALGRISEWFAEGAIPLCSLKGPLLAQRLFGDVSLRTCLDLDLLVHPESLPQAEALLLAHGCQRIFPAQALTARQWEAFKLEWHHKSFLFPGSRIPIELHWTIASPDLIAPGAVNQMLSRARPLAQSGGQLKCLAGEDLPAFLLLHGSKHNWVRLKWLVDYAAWLRSASTRDWQALQTKMADFGLLRCLGQGTLLAQQLFGVPAPGMQSWPEMQDRQIQKLAGHSIKAIQDLSYRGSEFGKLQRFKHLLYAAQLKGAWRYKWNTLRKFWIAPYDWQDMPLPDSLYPLYGLLRPFLWLRRYLQYLRR